jgi:sugar phosphate isomerase/epimerase
MDIKYLYPHWGSEALSAAAFIDLVHQKGFQGCEINLPKDPEFSTTFLDALSRIRQEVPDFITVQQQVAGVKKETPQEYLDKVLQRLQFLASFQPNFINSHTGKDHYSFDENCRIIEAIEDFSAKNGIPVYHEIHRGRFTFHSRTTLKYVEQFPNLKLVGDLSHWCVVSESMLQDQGEVIEAVIPHIRHIHARVGFEQSPQVNHAFAPEWETYLEIFTGWWQSIINHHRQNGTMTITPEFGPYPYMLAVPFSKQPIASQEELNTQMKDYLKTKLI